MDNVKIKHSGNRAGRIVFIVLSALLFVILSLGSYLIFFYPNVYSGVYFKDIPLGGLSRDELTECLNIQPVEPSDEALLVYFGDTPFSIPLSDLNTQMDFEATYEQIYGFGRNGDFAQNLRDIFRISSEKHITPVYTYDNAVAEKILTEKSLTLESRLVLPYHYLSGDWLIINKGSRGISYDTKSHLDEIHRQINEGDFSAIYITPEITEPEKLDLSAIAAEVEVKPVNAYYEQPEKYSLEIIPHTVGRRIDVTALEMLLARSEGEIKFPIEPLLPAVTAEALKEDLFGDCLADETTYLNKYNRPRTNNIRLAAIQIDGVVLMPGDIFSYNGIVGERTYEKGYRDAHVYTRDGIAEGLAGGICQLSSTIYMAVIRSNLEIVARSNHSYTVPYCPLGEDATVYYNAIDFKFRNNSDYPIKIETFQKDNYVVTSIYGKKTRDIEVKTERIVLSRSDYTTKTVVDETLAPGTTKVEQAGQIGLTCETYKVIYENGKEIARSLLNTSRYIPVTEIILVCPEAVPVEPVTPAETVPAVPEPSDGIDGQSPLDILEPITED